MPKTIEVDIELFRDLVTAADYVSSFYNMFHNYETPENCGDINSVEYLASEAASTVGRGRVVLQAVEQSVQRTACPVCQDNRLDDEPCPVCERVG